MNWDLFTDSMRLMVLVSIVIAGIASLRALWRKNRNAAFVIGFLAFCVIFAEAL